MNCDFCADVERLDIPTVLRVGTHFWLRPLDFFEVLGDFHDLARRGLIFWR